MAVGRKKAHGEARQGKKEASGAKKGQEQAKKPRGPDGRFLRVKQEQEIVQDAIEAGAVVVETPAERKRNAVSPVNGQPVPEGKPFETGDERAREAGRRSGEARREKGDLRRALQVWLESDVGTGKDGEKITGTEMMVRVAVKEIAKGNSKFWELVRDTAGFKPVDKVMVAEVDPEVVDEVERMVKEAGQ